MLLGPLTAHVVDTDVCLPHAKNPLKKVFTLCTTVIDVPVVVADQPAGKLETLDMPPLPLNVTSKSNTLDRTIPVAPGGPLGPVGPVAPTGPPAGPVGPPAPVGPV